MAAGTAGSRVTGVLRTTALAWALGVGTLSDAYNTANTVPNMLFALVAGGVLSSALVPMLVRSDDDDAENASVVLGTITVVSLVVAALVAVAAAPIISSLASGAGARHAEVLRLGAPWLRMFALQVPCYAVSVAAMGVLTARRRLTLGAAAGIATNLLTVAAAVLFVAAVGDRGPRPMTVRGTSIAILGWGTTLAVATTAAIQLWAARRVMPQLTFRPRLRHPAVTELRTLGRWMLVYVGVNQIGLAAVIAMASGVAGGVTAYQWAFMIMQLPYAIIAVSLFSAAYPTIATAAGSGDVTAALARPGRRAIELLLPAGAALAVLATPIAAALIGDDPGLVGAAVVGFAASLVPFSLFQLLTRASYAARDARTPALINIVANATMLTVDAAAVLLPIDPRPTLTFLALGHAASYVVGCLLLYRSLRRQGLVRSLWARAAQRLPAPAFAAAVMAGVLTIVPLPRGSERLAISLWLAVVTAVGAGLYLVIFRATSPDRALLGARGSS